MTPILIPEGYNYIAVFLTLACNLSCSYCINRFQGLTPEKGALTGDQWLRGLNRIISREDLPVTLGGGEPTLHPDFTAIVNGVRPELNLDLLTNLQFDGHRFMTEISPDRLRRAAPYASIRVSYHPETMPLEPLVEKVLRMQGGGYSMGLWGVLHPAHEAEILRAQAYCTSLGIDFRTKEFLGEYGGLLHGAVKYPGACDGTAVRNVSCRTSELIVGPTGGIYRCHGDLYEGREPVGHLLDPDFRIQEIHRPCRAFGRCNPCDVKVKTNRLQIFGHTSVDII